MTRGVLSCAALLLASGCATTAPAPSPDLSSGTPYCAGIALWELPDYPLRLAVPSGAIVTAGGADASGAVDVTLKTLGTPDEIAAFYKCALPCIGNGNVAALADEEKGFSYSGAGGARGKILLRAYEEPFPDDGWDTYIRIVEAP